MNKLKVLGGLLFACLLILGGCGGNSANNAPDGSQKDDPVLDSNKDDIVGGSKERGDGFGFTEFDLEIDVEGQDAIDIDYDVNEKAAASFENKLEGIDIEGEEAMNELNKLFVNIDLTKETAKEKVMEEILKYYQVDAYTKFDLDVYFSDGTHLEIKDTK